ncbi:MAG: hypothetical protein LBI62_01625 [Candidatus Accumulibacter sp.]|jgi:type IV pilus assembly protein PilY1|nr:hypothetical protein [Accumulibacter sp.]
MKAQNHFSRSRSRSFFRACLLALPLVVLPATVSGEPTDLSQTPISGASSMEIKPNILFILDDSYSMDWTYLPDWAGEIIYGPGTAQEKKWRPSSYQSYNASFNGVAYNPEVRYLPPSYFDDQGQPDTTTYPSQTSAATGGWTRVPLDGYGIQSADKVDLVGNAFYYQTVPGEYCADRALRDCRDQDAASAAFPVPAMLRWCQTAADAVKPNPKNDGDPQPACQAVFIDDSGAKGGGSLTYMYPRMPAPRTGTISLSGSGETTVESIQVNGREILSEPVKASTANDLAQEIARKIHVCATLRVGNCAQAGYDAEVLGAAPSKVVLYAPEHTGAQPGVVKSGGMSVTTYPFGPLDANVAGHVRLVPVTATVNSYPKAASRTDCVGNVCTYAEEMTNYANWHAYYRTRMQAMKTASSRSFEPIKDKYRIGYFSINNNTGTDFQNVADFGGAQKKAWYDKLFAASLTEGADTPLRRALSQAGWLFTGKYNGQTLNGTQVVDPMQYYCQPNVAILSTDGYWNREAGFMLDGRAVGDQDGPTSGEDRPILDNGAGLRNKRTERWTKRIEPQDHSWLQKQEEEWVVDKAGYQMSTKTEDQYEKGYLQGSQHQWRTERWNLKQSVYTEHWWHSASSVTKWKTSTARLRKYNYVLQQQVTQREMRTNTDITYVNGQLQRLPKQMYRKAERDLYMNVKQVYQRDKQGTGWSDRRPVESCTENATTICEFDSTNDTWTQVGSCTNRGRGKVNPTSTEGDNRFTIYETQVTCGYRYSATVVNVPNTTAAWPVVASCTSQGDKGSPYTVGHEVVCTPTSGNTSYAQNVESCTVDDDYTCRFVWESNRQIWDRTSDCLSYQGGGSAVGSTWTNPGKICYFSQYTDYTPVSSCTAGTANGTTTQCRDNPVVGTGTDGNGWKNVDSCTPSAAGQYDADGRRVNCQRKYLGYSNNATSCTPINSTTDMNQYDCEWYGQTAETEVDSCTPQGGEGSTWTGPWVKCTPVAFAPTCVNVGDAWYYVDPATQQPDMNRRCDYKWTGWSGFYGVSSCTTTGANRRNAPQPGDTQCRYEADPNNNVWSNTAQCTQPTTPPTPPSGWNNPATFPEGVTVSAQEYRQCYDRWLSPTNVTTCRNDGVFNRCSYVYDAPRFGECKPVAESSGNGTWDVVNPVKCSKGFKAEGWAAECRSDDQTKCEPMTLKDQPITDPDFDPAQLTDEEKKSGAKNYYHKKTLKTFQAIVNGQATTQIPTATEADPSPSNAGYCEVNPPTTPGGTPTPKVTYGVNGDGSPDRRKEITCRAVRPNASGTFYTAACPGNDPATNTTAGQQPSVDNDWVRITCGVSRTGPSVDKDCGKQSDGTLVNDIPATASNAYVRTICTPGSGDPTPDTLADVAEYYFKTDLRTPERGNCTGAAIGGTSTSDVCSNSQGTQKMSTYTLGLGASGVMQFEEGYEDESKRGDFHSVWKGVVADPEKGVCAWQLPGTECNWPRPSNNSQTNIDDLWHAAVNGRGTYFSAENPSAMAAGISAALQSVTAKQGSLASLSIDKPLLDAGSAAFQVSFTAGPWTGEVQKFKLSMDGNGALQLEPDWSAKAKLDAMSHVTRKIFTFDTGRTNNLKPFTWDDLSGGQKRYFLKPHIAGLSQLCATGTVCLPPASQNDPDFGEKLVNFLRGDRSEEGETGDLSKYFRKRINVLGDIVGSQAVYVQKPSWRYTDNGYADFREKHDKRRAMIYVGANDGMLHALDAESGQELWAFVPSIVLPDLHQLADKSYATQHRFFVDGTPVEGDVCISGCAAGESNPEWRTLLVGGLNRGGRGYYALDVTDPDKPRALWEFTHANLGYSYGNPVLTKLSSGKWVVLVSSGYNNVSPGDGRGHLFVLDARTGALIRDIATSAGSGTTPSGLAKIATWVGYSEYNNTALRVYGGDLMGNLWRFDINDNVGAAGYDAQRLVTLKDAKGNVQPITAPPELGTIRKQPVVFVGTGQLLGASDTETHDTQSLYAIKDRLTDQVYDDPRSQPTLFVKQTMSVGSLCAASNPYCVTGEPIVTVTKNPVDWANQNGWYVDFPVGGERVNVAMDLRLGTLSITTNTPQTGACVPAGVSNVYYLDYATGGYVLEGSDGLGGFKLKDDMGTSGIFVNTADGPKHLIQTDNTGEESIGTPDPLFRRPGDNARRISWRELIIETE